MGAAVKGHVGEEIGLVNLTSFCAGNSDPDKHILFHEIGEIIVGAVACGCFYIEIPFGVGPEHPVVNEEEIHPVFFLTGDLGQLKTPGRLLIVIPA